MDEVFAIEHIAATISFANFGETILTAWFAHGKTPS